MTRAFLALAATALLAACSTSQPDATNTMADDMLPSAQVTAFEQTDARLGYDDAAIAYDANNCAIYSATGPDGQPYSEPLIDESGNQICVG